MKCRFLLILFLLFHIARKTLFEWIYVKQKTEDNMETRNNQTVAFTGHRKERILQGFGNDPRILAQIREAVAGMVIELYGQGYKEYYTGMASGFNMTAAEAVLQVRERYEGIKLIAAVPFRKQPLWFEAEDRLLYARLLERMDREIGRAHV